MNGMTLRRAELEGSHLLFFHYRCLSTWQGVFRLGRLPLQSPPRRRESVFKALGEMADALTSGRIPREPRVAGWGAVRLSPPSFDQLLLQESGCQVDDATS
jgi:hypothetical protein